jgi:hypothetical protein
VKDFTIKGKVTKYTPIWAHREVLMSLVPQDIVDDLNKGSKGHSWFALPVIVNGRKATLQQGWMANSFGIQVTDEPAPPKKPHKLVLMARDSYMQFCHSGNWSNLIAELDYHRTYEYRKELTRLLGKLCLSKKCPDCERRFECLTTMTENK